MTRFNSDRAEHAHNRLIMGGMIPAAKRLHQSINADDKRNDHSSTGKG